MSPYLQSELPEVSSRFNITAEDLGGGETAVLADMFRLPEGWNSSETTILVRVPHAYPQAQLDQFCAPAELRLATGALPTNASVIHMLGRSWLQFSWHPRTWRPGIDNLTRYFAFITRRFMETR